MKFQRHVMLLLLAAIFGGEPALAQQRVAGPPAPAPAPAMIHGNVVRVVESGPVCKPCSDVEMNGLQDPWDPPLKAAKPDVRAVGSTLRAKPSRKRHAVRSTRPRTVASRPARKQVVTARRKAPPLVARAAMKSHGADCDKLRDQAQALMDRGETDAADKLLKTALAAEPGRPCLRTMVVRLALCRAHSAIACNYLECAARRLREVLYLEPNNRAAQRLLNDVYSAAGIDPDDHKQRAHIAQCLASNGRHVGALVEYRESSKLNALPSTHVGLARAALNTDQKGLALQEFQKAVKLDPFDMSSWEQIGFLQESRGKAQDAANAFLEAARLNPRNPVVVEKALQLTQQLASQFPQNIDRKLDLARAFLLTDQSPQAEQQYMQIAQMQPDTPKYEDWLTLEQENISLKQQGFAHRTTGHQLASNDVYKFLNEGPQPSGGGENQLDAAARLKSGCNCD